MAPDLKAMLETAGERLGGRLSGAHVGAHRHVHADEAGRARQHRADREADRDQPAERQADDEEDDDADHADGGVLALEIGLRAFAHGGGNFLHPGVPASAAHDRSRSPRCHRRSPAAPQPTIIHNVVMGLQPRLFLGRRENAPAGTRDVEDGRFRALHPDRKRARYSQKALKLQCKIGRRRCVSHRNVRYPSILPTYSGRASSPVFLWRPRAGPRFLAPS